MCVWEVMMKKSTCSIEFVLTSHSKSCTAYLLIDETTGPIRTMKITNNNKCKHTALMLQEPSNLHILTHRKICVLSYIKILNTAAFSISLLNTL